MSSIQRHRRTHLKVAVTLDGRVIASDAASYEEWLASAKLDTAADVLGFSKFLLWRLDRLVQKVEEDGDTRAAIAVTPPFLDT